MFQRPLEIPPISKSGLERWTKRNTLLFTSRAAQYVCIYTSTGAEKKAPYKET